MCRLFDANLLWIQEVTLYFYVISAVGAKRVLQRAVGTSDVRTMMLPSPHPQNQSDISQQLLLQLLV